MSDKRKKARTPGKAVDAGKGRKRGAPRRKVVPVWRRRRFLASVSGVALVAGLAGGWWLWSGGTALRLFEQARWGLIALSGEAGFRVDEILVVGREKTSRKELLEAVRLERGAPILAFDLGEARKRIERLSWVKTATVERMLPDTVFLRVRERTPMALWQVDGRFSLIGRDGAVILKEGVEGFADLPVIVGKGAPEQAAALLEMLGKQPGLMAMVRSAVWVGGRRWNLRLAGGIDVRLPEKSPERAWARLAEYERSHRVLGRGVKVLDLRVPDRLIVRENPAKRLRRDKPETFPPAASGRET